MLVVSFYLHFYAGAAGCVEEFQKHIAAQRRVHSVVRARAYQFGDADVTDMGLDEENRNSGSIGKTEHGGIDIGAAATGIGVIDRANDHVIVADGFSLTGKAENVVLDHMEAGNVDPQLA